MTNSILQYERRRPVMPGIVQVHSVTKDVYFASAVLAFNHLEQECVCINVDISTVYVGVLCSSKRVLTYIYVQEAI